MIISYRCYVWSVLYKCNSISCWTSFTWTGKGSFISNRLPSFLKVFFPSAVKLPVDCYPSCIEMYTMLFSDVILKINWQWFPCHNRHKTQINQQPEQHLNFICKQLKNVPHLHDIANNELSMFYITSNHLFIIWLAQWVGKMNQILHCDWLPAWAGKMVLSCPLGITCCVAQENSVLFLCNNSFKLTKLARPKWLNVGLVLVLHIYGPWLCLGL